MTLLYLKKNLIITSLTAALLSTSVALMPAQAQMQIDDPCPVPGDAASAPTTTLGQMQADIDRLTLCVERSRLLLELDKLSEEQVSTQFQSPAGGTSNIPALPEALPLLATDPMPAIQHAPKAPAYSDDGDDAELVIAAPVMKSFSNWQVSSVEGHSDTIKAVIINTTTWPHQTRTVTKGDEINGTKISEINVRGVTLKDNSLTYELNWYDPQTDQAGGNGGS